MKRMLIQDKVSKEKAKKEIEVWQKVSNHSSIVKYLDSEIHENEVLILCELCEGGFTLVDMIQACNRKIKEHVILSIMKDICEGVKYMHSRGIAHRDLKVENVLLKDNKFKIADFGSAEYRQNFLDWNKVSKMESDEKQVYLGEKYEIFEKNTTMMYRPPEMIDRYLKLDVGFQSDVWMLGCILFTLCFAKHPFQESGSLAIVNGQFFMPTGDEYGHITDNLRKLIKVMLTTDPSKRSTIDQVLQIITNLQKV